MNPYRRGGDHGRQVPSSTGLVLLAGLVVLACSPGDGGPERTAGEAAGHEGTAAPERGEAASADTGAGLEAPVCRFAASGEELTDRPSPPDSAIVQLNGHTAKLCYGAPSARGRQVMGGLVPYGEPWRMGANEPTTLHLPVAAEIGGVRVEPGSYALYAIPAEAEWTIVINSDPDRWGVPIDARVRASDVGSFAVTPERAEQPVERMSIRMEPVGDGAARVVLEWEHTRVSFPIQRAET